MSKDKYLIFLHHLDDKFESKNQIIIFMCAISFLYEIECEFKCVLRIGIIVQLMSCI
jgi:hypothetical protein